MLANGAGMIRTKTQLRSRVLKPVTIDDIALLYTDFDGTTVDAARKTVDARYRLSRSADASPIAHGR